MRLSWRKEPNETGLARTGQFPRGFDLRISGITLGSVRPLNRRVTKWYWHTAHPLTLNAIPRQNTAHAPVDTADEAKQACEAFWRERLGKTELDEITRIAAAAESDE